MGEEVAGAMLRRLNAEASGTSQEGLREGHDVDATHCKYCGTRL